MNDNEVVNIDIVCKRKRGKKNKERIMGAFSELFNFVGVYKSCSDL